MKSICENIVDERIAEYWRSKGRKNTDSREMNRRSKKSLNRKTWK
jgi:hypothetical protein